MCGIAGIYVYRSEAPPVDLEELLRIRDRMISRGPNGEGLWISDDQRIGLAHRRLSIIDLSDAGAQPMQDPDTGNCIVFNGEIYNYQTLRVELQTAGHVFRSHSDTEVLLKLYAEHGPDMLNKLRGMFAFAVWDARRQRLFLARDPLGLKPLYYADDGATFRFASQVKALVAGGGISSEPSAAGMAGFFLWGHVPEPWTWLAAVQALPAGCTLSITRHGPQVTPRRYFDLREEIIAAEQAQVPTGDVIVHTLEAVADSVRQHLVADVPVGAFLSAGRDSTLIAALAARGAAEPLRAITLSFDEYRNTLKDEVPVAAHVADLIGAHHETRRVTRGDFEAERERILDAMDQPSIDGVNTWFVSRAAAASGLKVVLSGLGGDELFGGYSSFRQVPALARRLRALAWAPVIGRAFRIVTAPLVRGVANPKWAGLAEYGGSVHGAWLLRRALFMPWEVPQLMTADMARRGLAELNPMADLGTRIHGIRSPALQVMALEMSGYMRNQLLRDADWAGMAHSLEIRLPLVDVALLRRFLPFAVHHLPFDRQRLLEAAAPEVAAAVGRRPKTGFGVPVQQWIAGGPDAPRGAPSLRSWARDVARRFSPYIASWRIGVLLTDAYGGIGGIAKFNRDLCYALASLPEVRDVDVLPRVVQGGRDSIPGKVEFDRAAARGKLAYMWRAVRLALDGPAICLVICGHINLLPLAWLVSRLKRCPLMLIVHGIDVWQPHRSPLVRALLPQTGAIVAVSRYTVERMRAWTTLPDSHFRILPNCVDLDTFTPRERNATLAGHFSLVGRRVLLTVGRLARHERYKGFDEVLEVLPQLTDELADLVYVIAGDGDDRARLEEKARKLGIAERVVFTGFVSEEEKIDLYNLADVYVMPSRGEGFGIVYLEAMACGLPVIGSTADGSRDALLDGKLGLLVDPDDREQLVRAIRTALALPRGRPVGLDHFSDHAYRERVGQLLRELARMSAA